TKLSSSTLQINTRSERLGFSLTAALTHSSGTTLQKVDVFDQVNHAQSQITIQLDTQTIVPSAQTYFVVYDIGNDAETGNTVGVRIADRGWIGVTAPNDVAGTLNVNVSKNLPNGTGSQNYPFSTFKVP